MITWVKFSERLPPKLHDKLVMRIVDGNIITWDQFKHIDKTCLVYVDQTGFQWSVDLAIVEWLYEEENKMG